MADTAAPRGWLLVEHVQIPGVDHVRCIGSYYTKIAAIIDKQALDAEVPSNGPITYRREIVRA